MFTLHAQNVNDAFALARTLVVDPACLYPPNPTHRNAATLGPVHQCRTAVTTVYAQPTQCVLWNEGRDANPFFHLFDALWCLAGRDDVALPAYWLPRYRNYSDDGTRLHGAYGYRWTHAFERDQLFEAVQRLRTDPHDRRVVLQMYDYTLDVPVPNEDYAPVPPSKDVPCNLMIAVQRDPEYGALHLTVFNRSNDIVWGCYGANAVQFGVLHEWLATSIGCAVGTLTQVSTNWHMYAQAEDLILATASADVDLYRDSTVVHHAMVNPEHANTFRTQLRTIFKFVQTHHLPAAAYAPRTAHPSVASVQTFLLERDYVTHPWLVRVLAPLCDAFALYRCTHHAAPLHAALECLHAARGPQRDTMTADVTDYFANDWLTAAVQWVARRHRARQLPRHTTENVT